MVYEYGMGTRHYSIIIVSNTSYIIIHFVSDSTLYIIIYYIFGIRPQNGTRNCCSHVPKRHRLTMSPGSMRPLSVGAWSGSHGKSATVGRSELHRGETIERLTLMYTLCIYIYTYIYIDYIHI